MKVQTLILFTYKDKGLYGELKVNAKSRENADENLLKFISETNRCIENPDLIQSTYESFTLVDEMPEVLFGVITED